MPKAKIAKSKPKMAKTIKRKASRAQSTSDTDEVPATPAPLSIEPPPAAPADNNGTDEVP